MAAMTAGQLSLLDTDWPARARRFIERLNPGEVITADALRSILGDPPESNMLGGVIQQAARRHLIVYGGRDNRSPRPLARGRWNRLWERTEKSA